MSGGAVSDNVASSSSSSSSYGADGGGVYVADYDGTFTMNGGAVSGNTVSSSSSYSSSGGGVYAGYDGTFTMNSGAVIGNTATSGGGVYVSSTSSYQGAFVMNSGVVSGNTATSGGGGVYVSGTSSYPGTFTMNGGAVSDNILSGMNSFGREVSVYGTFKISGDARPERVFLSSNSRYITITGPLTGGTAPIDLGSNSSPLASWTSGQILRLDNSYSSGDLAGLKARFTLGNATLTESPYTETPIPAEYTIGNNGKLIPPPSSGIGDITYSSVSGGDVWTLESDGRRKSPPIGDSSTTKARVRFTSTAPDAIITIALDVASNSGSAFISTLDNAAATDSSGYFTNSRISGTDSVTIAIPVPAAGSHFVDIGYSKSSSGGDGSDCAWFKVVE
jgi:hypothetical protein